MITPQHKNNHAFDDSFTQSQNLKEEQQNVQQIAKILFTQQQQICKTKKKQKIIREQEAKTLDINQQNNYQKKHRTIQKQCKSNNPKPKFTYTVISTPTKSFPLFNIIVLTIFIGAMFLIYFDYEAKKYALKNTIQVQIEKCELSFIENKCHAPIKALNDFCFKKRKCFQKNVEQELGRRIIGAGIIGTVIKQFIDNVGYTFLGLLLATIYITSKKIEQMQTKKQYCEY